MLILKRRRAQAVTIGAGITIQVLRLEQGAVFLAIDAPRELSIDRIEMDRADLEAARAAIDEALATHHTLNGVNDAHLRSTDERR